MNKSKKTYYADGNIYDFLILGAGLAGTMMARVLADHHPGKRIKVVDQRPTPDTKNHWALLRFRDTETARALGVAVREIEVEKAVYWQGRLHYTADMAMNNTYSLKTYGEIGRRSLKQLGMAKRYLPLTTPQPADCLWGAEVVSVSRNKEDDETWVRVNVAGQPDGKDLCCWTCISTLPMDVLLNATRWPVRHAILSSDSVPLARESIGVLRKQLAVKSSVNQTVYFPETRLKTYRATLEGSTLIVEFVDPDADGIVSELDEIFRCFGIPFTKQFCPEIEPADFHIQPVGKILSIDDDMRRDIIYRLTDTYNLYSVGRFATWRPLRADQLVKDVFKVERMIRMGTRRNKYERRLNDCEED